MSDADKAVHSKKWMEAKKHLRGCVDEVDFGNWLESGLWLVERENGTVKLGVATRFWADWVYGHFSQQIGEAVHLAFGDNVGFEIVIDESLTDAGSGGVVSTSGPKSKPELYPARSQQVTSVAKRPFVVCDENRLAYAAVMEFAQGGELAKRHTLCIYGDPGCGKSHLMEEVLRVFRTKNPSANILLEDGENFTRLFTTACQGREGTGEFHRRRATCALFILDEAHYLAGNKKATQAELVAIWNDVVRKGNKIIIVSQKPPALIEPVSRELASRLLGTTALPMSMPKGDGRLKILEQILVEEKLMGPLSPKPEVLKLLMETPTDTRELIGLASSLFTEIRLRRASMEAHEVKRWLVARLPEDKQATQLDYDSILTMTANHFGVPAKVVKENGRRKEVVVPRQVAMFLCQKLLPNGSAALSRIGTFFGKDHSTVSYAVTQVTNSEELLEQAEFVAKKLGCTLK